MVLVILHHYIPVVTALVLRLTTGSAQGSASTLVAIATLMLVWCVAAVRRETKTETETERGRKEDENNYQLIIA